MSKTNHTQIRKGPEQRALFDSLHDGLIFFAPDSTVLYLNSAARKMLQCEEPHTTTTSASRFDTMIGQILKVRDSPDGEMMQVNAYFVKISFFPYLPDEPQIPGFTVLLHPSNIADSSQTQSRATMKNKGFVAKSTFDDIICESPASKEAVRLSKQYALTSSNILVVGESGSGKEVFVQALHNASTRKNGPFVAINCAALPENLLESELFGYVGGAFTGAVRQGRKGYFELADKGTIFLDEIGEVSPKLQARLLRVIQEKEITRVGDEKVIHVDTRIISATNKDLRDLVDRQLFREDLYYRIDVLRVSIPPIRERKEDIPTLIKHLLLRVSPHTAIQPDAVALLTAYPWPGNIRQLNNLCERAIALSDKVLINVDIIEYLLKMEDVNQHRHIQPDNVSTLELKLNQLPIPASDINFLKASLIARQRERDYYSAAMQSVQNNKTLAAKNLGISRSTLWRKLKSLNLD